MECAGEVGKLSAFIPYWDEEFRAGYDYGLRREELEKLREALKTPESWIGEEIPLKNFLNQGTPSSFDGGLDELELSLFRILFMRSLSLRRRVFSFSSFPHFSVRAAFSFFRAESYPHFKGIFENRAFYPHFSLTESE